jgi:hypothetical protein
MARLKQASIIIRNAAPIITSGAMLPRYVGIGIRVSALAESIAPARK